MELSAALDFHATGRFIAYYAIFHLLVEDFVGNWPFSDQRARLARTFDHKKMRDAAFTPTDEKSPTPTEAALVDVKTAFRQLQADRHRADYDLSWNIVPTDVTNAITLAEDTFTKWRLIRGEDIARHHLLSMFGATRRYSAAPKLPSSLDCVDAVSVCPHSSLRILRDLLLHYLANSVLTRTRT